MRAALGIAGAGALGGLFVLAALAASFAPALSYPVAASSPSTGRLGVAEIGALAEAAGFRGSGVAMAIAVALAESGGDPGSTGHNTDGSVDRGLWQINSVHGQFSPACDYDPPCAAAAAYKLSSGGTNWRPWVTWQTGAEIRFLPQALSWVTRAEAGT